MRDQGRFVSALWARVLVGAALFVLSAMTVCGQEDAAPKEETEEIDVQPIVALLREPDKEFRALALEQIRNDYPGAAATRQFAELLPTLPAESQVGLLRALADRGDKAAAPAVRERLSNSDNEDVRIAAIRALGKLGQPEDLPTLIEFLTGGSDTEQEAAHRSLVVLPGEEISGRIADEMREAPASVAVPLIGILKTRRARQTVPALLHAAVSDQPQVRRAAMDALREMAEPKHVSAMVQGVLKAERGQERDAAEKAVMLVCHRIENPAERDDPLLAAMDDLPQDEQTILLSTLGRVGGPDARKVIEAAIRDPNLHNQGIEALCNWPYASIAFRLLELARTDEHPGHRRRALRALIRVAPFPDGRPDQLRLDLMRTAMAMAWEEEDRRLILERSAAIRTLDTLRFVLPYTNESSYSEQACLTVVELAHHSELREKHREEFHAALDRVIETSNSATVVDRARRYKKGQTWVRPK